MGGWVTVWVLHVCEYVWVWVHVCGGGWVGGGGGVCGCVCMCVCMFVCVTVCVRARVGVWWYCTPGNTTRP